MKKLFVMILFIGFGASLSSCGGDKDANYFNDFIAEAEEALNSCEGSVEEVSECVATTWDEYLEKWGENYEDLEKLPEETVIKYIKKWAEVEKLQIKIIAEAAKKNN